MLKQQNDFLWKANFERAKPELVRVSVKITDITEVGSQTTCRKNLGSNLNNFLSNYSDVSYFLMETEENGEFFNSNQTTPPTWEIKPKNNTSEYYTTILQDKDYKTFQIPKK